MKLFIALAANGHLPGTLVTRLVKKRPDSKDLAKRLLSMPVIKRGKFVENLPTGDNALIAYAEKKKCELYMGYRIKVDGDKDYIDTLLFCVDNDRVVESVNSRLEPIDYYVGIPIPAADIKAKNYALKFERLDYVLANLG